MALRPFVSIVIPVYNGSDYLREAIDSALAQTYPDVEVLVVNDGSDDDGRTDAIAISYGENIRYFRKENGGVASALNLGIREMRGEHFSWLSHDDVYLPQKIDRQVAILAGREGDAVLYADYEAVDAGLRPIEVFRAGKLTAPDFRRLLITDIPVNGCTTLVPRRCFERVGLFDERLRTTQDYDMWFRLARLYPFVHIPEILLRSRKHAGQGTRWMTDTCFTEGNDGFIGRLDQMAQEQHPDIEPSLVRFFLRAAVRLKRRGYIPASEHALALHLRYVDAGPLRGAFYEPYVRRYHALCDRRWMTFVPRLAAALSDRENLQAKIGRLLRRPG